MIATQSPAFKARHIVKWQPDANTKLWLPGDGDPQSATIRDRSGNGNHGTLNGDIATRWAKQSSGVNALDFNGTGDNVSVTDAASLDITGNMTVAAWVKVDTFSAAGAPTYGVRRIMGKSADLLAGYSFLITASAIYLDAFGQVDDSATIGTTINTGTWYFLAASESGGVVRFIQNGTSLGTGTKTAGFIANNDALLLGDCAGANSGQRMDGKMWGHRLWNTDKTPAYLINIFNQERHLFNV